MSAKRNSVASVIDDLARLTEASPTYVEKIRALLEKRGVSLEQDAAPFLDALEEVFIRQQAIRENVAEARDNLARLRHHLGALGARYDEPLERIEGVQESLHRQLSVIREANERLRSAVAGTRSGSAAPRRTKFATMVPGPEELH